MTWLQSVPTTARPQVCEARNLGCRQAVEILIHEITESAWVGDSPPHVLNRRFGVRERGRSIALSTTCEMRQ